MPFCIILKPTIIMTNGVINENGFPVPWNSGCLRTNKLNAIHKSQRPPAEPEAWDSVTRSKRLV